MEHYEAYTVKGATFNGKQIYGARELIVDMHKRTATVTAGFWNLSYAKDVGTLEVKLSARSSDGDPLTMTLTFHLMDFGFECMATGYRTGTEYRFSGQIYHTEEPIVEGIVPVLSTSS